jgi:hypothetical protein
MMNHRGTEDAEEEFGAEMKGRDVAEEDPLTGEIIGAAIEVHRCFGPGLLERQPLRLPPCAPCLGGSFSIVFARIGSINLPRS